MIGWRGERDILKGPLRRWRSVQGWRCACWKRLGHRAFEYLLRQTQAQSQERRQFGDHCRWELIRWERKKWQQEEGGLGS